MDPKLTSVEISKNLLSKLRTFKHEEHQFEATFIPSLSILISDIPRSYEAVRPFVSDVHKFYLALHFYIAGIENLETLYAGLDLTSRSQINNTNLMTLDSLWGAIKGRLAVKLIAPLDPIDPMEISSETKWISLTLGYTKGKLSVDVIEMGMATRGKLYPDLVAYVAQYLVPNDLPDRKPFFPIIFRSMKKTDSQIEALTAVYSNQAELTIENVKSSLFTNSAFDQFIYNFVHYKELSSQKFSDLKKSLESEILNALVMYDQDRMDKCETLMIALMGHPDFDTREMAIRSLNVLYDGVDWQLRNPFKPKISVVGEPFILDYMVNVREQDEPNVFIIVSATSFSSESQDPVVSWHKPRITRKGKLIAAHLELGNFTKPGFYDWNMVQLKPEGKVAGVYKIYDSETLPKTFSGSFGSFANISTAKVTKSKPVHGRFIVHPASVHSLQVHEICVDNQAKDFHGDVESGKVGSFENVESNLAEYKEHGVNCLYLLGALQRDNGFPSFSRPNTSPLAVTNRVIPNSMLGGAEKFENLVNSANTIGMSVLVDCLTRVSSSRPNKKYRRLLLHVLDSEGKREYCYGTDGRSLQFKDTSLLNYRKKEAWDLLLDEVIEFASKYPIAGIHLDNGQAWPQIFSLDIDELYRLDDGCTPAYNETQIFFGDVVKRDENCGYWGSKAKNDFANPMIVKLCKSLWRRFPSFLLLAEVWGGISTDDREFQMIRSGVIPRSFKIPMALSTIFGQRLRLDGQVTPCQKKSVHVFTQWYESFVKHLPIGSILVQSTTSTFWPTPAFLYERGTWAAVDLFYFFPDIPMTFMGELSGKSYRNAVTNIVLKLENTEANFDNFTSITPSVQDHSLSLMGVLDEDKKFFENAVRRGDRSSTNEHYVISERPRLTSDQLRGMEDSFARNVGPQYGFDIKKIGSHYKHRSLIRNAHEVLRLGKVVTLTAEHAHGLHSHVLAFARIYMDQIALIAINFNDGPVDAFINTLNLTYTYKDCRGMDLVMEFGNGDVVEGEGPKAFYSLPEFLGERHYMGLGPYKSTIWVGKILKMTPDLHAKLISSTLSRLKGKISSKSTIRSNYISDMFSSLLTSPITLQRFIDGYCYYKSTYAIPYELGLAQTAPLMASLMDNPQICAKLFAFSKCVGQLSISHLPQHKEIKNLPGIQQLLDLRSNNTIKSIAFATPEYGRWTTMGGIGVLLNEMLPELALLGESVIVVTPYYYKKKETDSKPLELNNTGETTFSHLFNFPVGAAGTTFEVGVHGGVVNGVQIYFLSNYDLFPYVYVDGDAHYTMKQITVFGKAVLQLFCCLGKFPDLIVNNDWFCGLIPAYAKRQFGGVFKDTKFIHIAHNLHPSYEGRIYPKKEEGSLGWIHGLPDFLLVDDTWGSHLANPSRAALLETDNWATVSLSYREELMNGSPLAPLLRAFPHPFAYPNGIRTQKRLEIINSVCGNDHLLAKAKIQKDYFGFAQPDPSFCILSFVGRITEQKGVHLICEVAEELINRYPKVQFLVGGPASTKDKYGLHCYNYIKTLRNRYPHNFYGDPDSFFMEGALVNCGSNYGLMPSLFEPGGIVQHEFFVGSTPVIAFKTGGLRDTVHNYSKSNKEGSGYVFENYNPSAFKAVIEEGLRLFFDSPEDYKILRTNAFEATINLSDVAKAWDKEFHRIFGKTWSSDNHKPACPIEFKVAPDDLFTGGFKQRKLFARIERIDLNLNITNISFKYQTPNRVKEVVVSGSFDNWASREKLKYDPISDTWTRTLGILPGTYLYKYRVDGVWDYSKSDPMMEDEAGNINNILKVDK